MLSLSVIAVLVSVASASPTSRQGRGDAFDPFAGGFAYAGFPFGAYAGAGVPMFFNPWDFTRSYIPWFPFVMPSMEWYKGPNVCEETKISQEPEEIKQWLNDDSFVDADFQHQSKSCRGTNTKYVCFGREVTNQGSQMIVTKYECCHGFVRPSDGRPGCVESSDDSSDSQTVTDVQQSSFKLKDKFKYSYPSQKSFKIDLKDLLPALRSMGASRMVSIAQKVGLTETLHSNNYTILCPLNSALESFDVKYKRKKNQLKKNVKLTKKRKLQKSKLSDWITSHMIQGFHKMDELSDDRKMQAVNQATKIRFNIYYNPEKVVTANCIPIVSGDHFARNGVIHQIQKALPRPYKTVADVIAGDAQFSVLKGLLSRAGLVQTLRNPNGTYTVFAPTDSAFSSPLSGHSPQTENRCAVSLIKHHVIDHVICSSALPHYARTLNVIGEILSLTRDKHNKLYVDDTQIVVRDIMATNGVVHVIDGLLSTRQAQTISQILEASGLKEFLNLLERANLKTTFDALENVTFFIPSNEVIQGIIPRHLNSLQKHNNTLADLLLYHVAEGQTDLKIPEQRLNSKLQNASIRVQIRSLNPHSTPKVLVQCATMVSLNHKLCGGTFHVINRILSPPKQTIMEFLESIEGFSTLALLLKATGLDRRLMNLDFQHTLLAPTDDAFHRMGQDFLFQLLEDLEMSTALLKMHIMSGAVCCSQLTGDLLSGRQQSRAIDGFLLRMERSRHGSLLVGGARIVDCDIMATNGIVHMTDAIVSPDSWAMHRDGLKNNVFVKF